MRKLKGLEDVISFDVVDYFLDSNTGWTLMAKTPGSTIDSVNNFKYLREVYLQSDPKYEGSITVPVLYDKKTHTIVNNESADIIRMLNSEFEQWATKNGTDYYPKDLQDRINELNTWIYSAINNGVYKCGFAKSQEAYSQSFKELFDALDKVESILQQNRYLCGNQFTEADIRLFTTLLRFDPVYHTHFKTNKKRIIDYPNLWDYTREIYQMDGIAETVNMFHIKHHYYESHRHINPFGIVPDGPEIDFAIPHQRDAMQKLSRTNSSNQTDKLQL